MGLRFMFLVLGGLLAGAAPLVAASAQGRSADDWVQPRNNLPRSGHGEATYSLDTLFSALKIAPDDSSAKAIEDRIWAIWMSSDSDTCNLLMSRVKVATDDKDYDLAVKLLNAIVTIKPDYVEAWN